MLLSQNDAKARWCPFARVARREEAIPRGAGPMEIVAGTNRDAFGGNLMPASCRCLAEDCMSWRWAGWETPLGTVATRPLESDRIGPRLGYCGLAGQPHVAG